MHEVLKNLQHLLILHQILSLNISLQSCSFVKTWRVANNGDDKWPEGCYIAFTGGVNLSPQATVSAVALGPGEFTDLSVEMSSPSQPGMYESKWRMATPYGSYFGGSYIIQIIHKQIIQIINLSTNRYNLGDIKRGRRRNSGSNSTTDTLQRIGFCHTKHTTLKPVRNPERQAATHKSGNHFTTL